MGIREDYPLNEAEQLEKELQDNPGKCFYDERLKKIVYHNDEDALHVHNQMESDAMKEHKWLESQKAGHDLGEEAAAEWIKANAEHFRKFWEKTHVRIPEECRASS